MEFIYDSEFWVAVSFFIFIGVLVYLGMITVSAHNSKADTLKAWRYLEKSPRWLSGNFGVT